MRQIILDTETTGLDPEQGHRIIEIAAVEMINRRLTGQHFHRYLNPEREIEAGALAVHGISNEFLADKPYFPDILEEFLQFISGAQLIIHNAPFDVSFLEHEMQLAKHASAKIAEYCQVIDTLQMARQLHPGQRNNLDALCKRYHVDNTHRELHGALLDAEILALVYLAMTGGQGSLFDTDPVLENAKQQIVVPAIKREGSPLRVISADEAEVAAHEEYLAMLAKSAETGCVWLEE